MSIYLLSVGFDTENGSGLVWSETKEMPKPGPPPLDWSITQADAYKLGPFPTEFKETLEAHQALTGASNADAPRFLLIPGSNYATGLQAMIYEPAKVFEDHADGACELYQLSSLWSLKDKAEMKELYYYVNVYGNAPTVDLELSNVRPVRNPQNSQPYILSGQSKDKVVVHPGRQGKKHVWRDSNTYVWFCDDVFRDAIEKVSPGDYHFSDVTILDKGVFRRKLNFLPFLANRKK